MFGQMIFAELPFAEIGRPPYLEAGWIKVCPEHDGWAKVPANSSGWQVVDRSLSDWNKQPINDVNTIECGDFQPTNISGLKN
tara:strand:+ start:221 stop:466 length:246 start_codon:yes stop_codon:yes gene_type:complete